MLISAGRLVPIARPAASDSNTSGMRSCATLDQMYWPQMTLMSKKTPNREALNMSKPEKMGSAMSTDTNAKCNEVRKDPSFLVSPKICTKAS